MIAHPWGAFRGKRVLLLQGPVGPFFRRLARLLEASGAVVHKVNFNGGDCLFYPTKAVSFRGTAEQWPAYFESLLERLHVDIVMLFGDCRPLHRAARQIAHRLGVQVGAFEEGYVRPNFITFERFGVNGYSLVPRRAGFYAALPERRGSPEREVGNTFWAAALWANLYYLASALLRPAFSRYRHHRLLALREIFPWLRAAWRKAAYSLTERKVMARLTGACNRKFFLAPLQVSIDSQISEHSRFVSVADFIRLVVESFAAHAPDDTVLVIKHHPFDRGYHDYTRLIGDLAAAHRLYDRLLYIHDQHLPTLFEHMRGAVVINSTVGFSALTHDAPIKTLGVAVYDLDGLTFQGSLEEFWAAAETFRPNRELLERFRNYLIERTQMNGSFYSGRLYGSPCTSMLSVAHGRAPQKPAAPAAVGGTVTRSAAQTSLAPCAIEPRSVA